MAGSKPLSWKWKLTIVFVILFFAGMAILFSTWGHKMMKGWIKEAYEQCPAEERVTHSSADWYLLLADFEARACWRDDLGMEMYEEFLAIRPGKNGDFFKTYQSYGPQWNGFFDKKTKTGWGIMHERAPEAYYKHLLLYQPRNTMQFTTARAVHYHTLFYKIYPQLAKSKKYLPHPKFYKYWERIRDRLIERRFMPPGADITTQPKPADFEGPI